MSTSTGKVTLSCVLLVATGFMFVRVGSITVMSFLFGCMALIDG